MRSSARRSRAAATSSIAFVILPVLRTDRIRRLMSCRVAISKALACDADHGGRAGSAGAAVQHTLWEAESFRRFYRDRLMRRVAPLRGRVELGPELRKGFELAVLRQLQPQAPGDFLHRLRLRAGTHAGD